MLLRSSRQRAGWRRELETRRKTRGVIRAGCPALSPRTPGIERPEPGHQNTASFEGGSRLRFGVISAAHTMRQDAGARQALLCGSASAGLALQPFGHHEQDAIRFITALGRMARCPSKEFGSPAEFFRMRHSTGVLSTLVERHQLIGGCLRR
jgi:hypothetical protein